MRFRLPDACHGVTLGGVTLEPAADGTVEAAASVAADLAPHGIVPVDEPRPAAAQRAGRTRSDAR